MNTLNHPSPAFWHERFIQQAHWTRAIRQQLFRMIKKEHVGTILEVGSGTGVIAKELVLDFSAAIIGLDLDLQRLQFAKDYIPECLAVSGDGEELPFGHNTFDACICHFLLLWVDEPSSILREMVRTTRPGGWIIALAEPDYGGRIDHPFILEELGHWQTAGLEAQGANPRVGRQLRTFFADAGLTDIKVGVLGGEWSYDAGSRENLEEEWSILLSDLTDLPEVPDLDAYHSAWFDDGRILFVPTFYAMGRVPG